MFVSLTGEDAYEGTLAELETAFANLPEAGEVRIGSINTGTSNDLQVTVTGDDPEDLEATAGRVENTLSTTPGLVDVSSDLSAQRPLLRVDVDKRKAASLGFTQAEVGQAIANALRGTEVGTVVLQGESRDIMVRPQQADEASPKQIAALGAAGQPAPAAAGTRPGDRPAGGETGSADRARRPALRGG
jgi:HAE1 family hydrophobic/amphiphilic exporter-1